MVKVFIEVLYQVDVLLFLVCCKFLCGMAITLHCVQCIWEQSYDFCLLMCWITLIYIWMLNQPSILSINSHLFRMYYPFHTLLYRYLVDSFIPLPLWICHCISFWHSLFLMRSQSISWSPAALLLERALLKLLSQLSYGRGVGAG